MGSPARRARYGPGMLDRSGLSGRRGPVRIYQGRARQFGWSGLDGSCPEFDGCRWGLGGCGTARTGPGRSGLLVCGTAASEGGGLSRLAEKGRRARIARTLGRSRIKAIGLSLLKNRAGRHGDGENIGR